MQAALLSAWRTGRPHPSERSIQHSQQLRSAPRFFPPSESFTFFKQLSISLDFTLFFFRNICVSNVRVRHADRPQYDNTLITCVSSAQIRWPKYETIFQNLTSAITSVCVEPAVWPWNSPTTSPLIGLPTVHWPYSGWYSEWHDSPTFLVVVIVTVFLVIIIIFFSSSITDWETIARLWQRNTDLFFCLLSHLHT